jgi:trehalose synthase-fused probable maltokinase
VPVGAFTLLIVAIDLDDGARDRYAVPVVAGEDVRDALDDPDYARALLALTGATQVAEGEHGALRGIPTRAFPHRLPPPGGRRLTGEQSNTSVVLGDTAMLKHFRRLQDGRNPDEEITRFLTDQAPLASTPRLLGHVEYIAGASTCTLAVVHELITGGEDGWAWMLERLREGFRAGAVPPSHVTLGALTDLGRQTARLHIALASDPSDPAFAPEPITADDIARWTRAIEEQLDAARRAAPGAALTELPALRGALEGLLGSVKIRHHGDFHLGQTLYTGGRAGESSRPTAWVLLDFEGEPLRPIAERRQKHVALRDVAGMLRSIDYAAVSAMPPGAEMPARAWRDAASSAFLDGYRRTASDATFVPRGAMAFERAVAAFVLEKAAYEVVYEANHRPGWLPIPIAGLRRAASAITRGREAGAA